MAQIDRYPHPHEHSALCPLLHPHQLLLYSPRFHHRLFSRNHLPHESAFVFSEFGLGFFEFGFGFDFELELGTGIGIGIECGIGFGPALGILPNLD